MKTLAANPRICVKSPDFGVVDGATVVAEMDVAKSLAGVNNLFIEPTNGDVVVEDVARYADVMTLDTGTASVAVANIV